MQKCAMLTFPRSCTGLNIKIVVLLVLSLWTEVTSVLLVEDIYTFPPSVKLKDGQVFDYIVVGAGAGGAPAASRLALRGHRVLLLEAGGDPNLLTQIPSAAMGLLGSNLDWHYKTIPNNQSCLASVDRQCRFSRGKCLGGSTSINYMLYTRGNRQADFQDIPYPGWTFDDLMPYFLRYENNYNLDQFPISSRPYHNTTGNMRVGFFDDSRNPWHNRLISSFRSLQFPLNLDVNANSQIGVSKVIGYVYRGERMSTARAYLIRDDVQKHLRVAKNTMCTGVLIDNENVAIGVTVVQGGLKLKLYAHKEVILSAGAIGTPQILMLSGIGPADHLRRIGIPVKANLPVGESMTDHVLPLLLLQVDKEPNITNKLKILLQMVASRSGAITSNGLTDVTIFANTRCYDFSNRMLRNKSSDGSDCNVPNLQIINAYLERYLLPLIKTSFKRSVGFVDDVIDQMAAANEDSALITMSPVLLKPFSVGHVRLANSDPLAPPAIFPNYLGDERDVDEMVRAIGIIEHMVDTKPFRRRNASLLRFKLRGCPAYEANREGYWRCYVRHMTFSVFHAAGTAALGRVLDERLRVRGVRRLRVADLSALPSVPRANTATVSIAIGERAADFILEDSY